MADRITVYLEGRPSGTVLTAQQHLATGGEGAVYLNGGQIFKVYLDPVKAQKNGVDKKVSMLQAMKHPGVAVPHSILRDKAGHFLGIAMPHVTGEPLCTLFTTAGRDRANFGTPQAIKVVDAMREITQHAHDHKALMVDANELNWLIDGVKPVAIDTDSWQLPGYPATAIMPSIRDYQMDRACGFTEGTDWFAWAIVTFQIWTGIHPYKGTHPSFGRGDLEGRMRAMASVFDAGVRLPGAARDPQQIPARLKDWYAETFATDVRIAPPRAADSVIAPMAPRKLKSIHGASGNLRLEKILGLPGSIAATAHGFLVVRTPQGMALWDTLSTPPAPVASMPSAWISDLLHERCTIVRLGHARLSIHLDSATGQLEAKDLDNGTSASLKTVGQKLWQAHNRVFVLADNDDRGLHEIDLARLGDRLVVGQKQRWAVNVLSTRFLRNVCVQDALGVFFVGVATVNGFVQGAAPGLKGYRVAEGFAPDEYNVWLTATRILDGESVRLRLALVGGKFEVQHEIVASTLALEAAMTGSGIGVLRDDDDLLATKGRSSKTVGCSGLSPDLRLFSMGPSIGAFEGSELFRLSLV